MKLQYVIGHNGSYIFRILVLVCLISVLSPNLQSPILNYHHPIKIAARDIQQSLTIGQLSSALDYPVVLSDPRTMVLTSGLTDIQSPIPRLLLHDEYDEMSIWRIESLRENVFLAHSTLQALSGISDLIANTPSTQNLLNGDIKLDSDFTYLLVINPRTLHWLVYGSVNQFLFYDEYEFSNYDENYRSYTDYYDLRGKLVQAPASSVISDVSLWVHNQESVQQKILLNLTETPEVEYSELSIMIEVPPNFEGWVNSTGLNFSWPHSSLCVKMNIPQGVLTRYDLAPPHDYIEFSKGQYDFEVDDWISYPPRHLWLIVNYGSSGDSLTNLPLSELQLLYESGERFLIPFADSKYVELIYKDPKQIYVFLIKNLNMYDYNGE